jgi:hypothetical protein
MWASFESDAVLRQVGQVGRPEEGEEVVRAQGVEPDVGHGHDLRIALGVGERPQHGFAARIEAREELPVGSRHAQRRAREVGILEVESKRLHHVPETSGHDQGTLVLGGLGIRVGRGQVQGRKCAHGHTECEGRRKVTTRRARHL